MTAANKNWHDTNVQLARANDLGEKLANPFNDFVMGAATGAGWPSGVCWSAWSPAAYPR